MTEYRHEIPMRWADLDSLNHVNNVVYVAYAQNARAAVDTLPPGPIGAMTVEFARPLLLGRAPVVVTTRVEGATVLQTIGLHGTDTVFATVETGIGAYEPAPVSREGVHVAQLALRHTDLGPDGAVTQTQVFELFQETRVPFMDTVLDRSVPGSFVLARVAAHFHRPVAWRRDALQARSWVSRVGNGSFTIEAQLADEAGVIATSSAILVGFDAATQRSRPLSQDERDRLTAAKVSPAS